MAKTRMALINDEIIKFNFLLFVIIIWKNLL